MPYYNPPKPLILKDAAARVDESQAFAATLGVNTAPLSDEEYFDRILDEAVRHLLGVPGDLIRCEEVCTVPKGHDHPEWV